MSQKRYIKRLRRAYRSEVFGEALYAMAARIAVNPAHRRKWEVLRDLEIRMKHQLSAALARAGVTTRERAVRRGFGATTGVLLGLLPWRLAMLILASISRWSAPFFEEVESEAAARRELLLDGLGAHECAQREFARRELAHDSQRSLHEVLLLLGRGTSSSDGTTKAEGSETKIRKRP